MDLALKLHVRGLFIFLMIFILSAKFLFAGDEQNLKALVTACKNVVPPQNPPISARLQRFIDNYQKTTATTGAEVVFNLGQNHWSAHLSRLAEQLQTTIPAPTADEKDAILFYGSAYIEQHLKYGDFSSVEGAGKLLKYAGIEKFQFSETFVEQIRFWAHAIDNFTLAFLIPGSRHWSENDRSTGKETFFSDLSYMPYVRVQADSWKELSKKEREVINQKTLEQIQKLAVFKNRTATMQDVEDLFKVRELVLALHSRELSGGARDEINFKGLHSLVFNSPRLLERSGN
ncbi:MAG: hypothetical protein JWQ35_2267 [Bacteriovoracaceae bacterium]|nr:hypothetical protein [Bacteriovoracaceae bacterium]